MEFVAYGEGDGDVNENPDSGLGQMSEKVQAIAQSIYLELEGMVRKYGPEPAQTVTPFLVRLLETLDEEIKNRRSCQTELELAKADREQLLNHFERERDLRKKAEESQFIAEDEADLDKSTLQTQLDDLEGRLRYLDTRAQNYDDVTRRAVETEDHLKQKYADLSRRHDETLQKYINSIEENKSLRTSQVSTPMKDSKPNRFETNTKIIRTEAPIESYHVNIIGGENIVEVIDSHNSSSSDRERRLEHNRSLEEELNDSLQQSPYTDSSDIPEDVQDLIAKTDVINVGGDDVGCDLSTQATFDSQSTSSRSFAGLEEENTRLMETKNALNVVKDDLLRELEEMTNRYATVKVEFEKAKREKEVIHKRVTLVEADLERMKSIVDNDEADPEDEPTEKRKRFTRVEMARVLMERNQYKERLMELQEAVRWTEMLRVSKYEQLEESKAGQATTSKGKRDGIYTFFSRLFGASTENAPKKSPSDFDLKSPTSTISPSNSTELSELCKVAGFVQDTEKHMSQMCGWMLPEDESGGGSSSNIPVPNHCAPLADKDSANSKIWCATTIESNGETVVCVASASRSKATRITLFKSTEPQNDIHSFTLNDVVVLCQVFVPGSSKPKTSSPTGTIRPDSIDATKGTVWFGSQHGIVYVHGIPGSPQTENALGQIRLVDSVVSLNANGNCVIAALANGSLATIGQTNGVWNFSDVKIVDFGAPHYAIGCTTFVQETQTLWCGYRNQIKIVPTGVPDDRPIKTVQAHPRNESRIRLMSKFGSGVWVSIRLDSTLRLYDAKTGQHLQDLDCEPFVSKIFGDSLYERPSFSFVRITALHAGRDRLWIGTGHGIVLAIPYMSKVKNQPSKEKPAKLIVDDSSPVCSMTDAQLSVHGFREAVKFFIDLGLSTGSEKIAAGGIGYIDFRTANQSNLSTSSDMLSKSYMIAWQN